ncbi:MAG: tetratricopeptide repeat protein [Betaproteobacteria bacterium]|nr:tetratricopeptide repeat protein [Betaproteobacteria bacterium]
MNKVFRNHNVTQKIRPFCQLALLATLFTSGCASVSIKSKPSGAEVYLSVPGRENPQLLGPTPYNKDLAEIKKLANTSTIVLTVKRSGYVSQNFVVPNLGGGQLEIEALLQPLGSEDFGTVNLAVRLVLEAERQIIDRNLKEALKTLEKAKAANPNIAAIYYFEGYTYSLQNDKEKAREALYKALALDPQDTEVRSMLSDVGGSAEPPAAAPKGRKK